MIVKIALIGICVCLMGIFLRQYNNSFVILLNMAFAAVVMITVFNYSSESLSKLEDLFSFNSVTNKMLLCLLKAGMICILSKLSCDICRESGNKAVADIIELSSKIMLIIIALPYIESIFTVAKEFVK